MREIQDRPAFPVQSDAPARRVAWDRVRQCSSGPPPTGEYGPASCFHQRSRVSPWQWLFVKAHWLVESSKHLRTPRRELRWQPSVADSVRQGVATRQRTFAAEKSLHSPCGRKYTSIRTELLLLFIDAALAWSKSLFLTGQGLSLDQSEGIRKPAMAGGGQAGRRPPGLIRQRLQGEPAGPESALPATSPARCHRAGFPDLQAPFRRSPSNRIAPGQPCDGV